MKTVIHNDYLGYKDQLDQMIEEFDQRGKLIAKSRNTIKIIDIDELKVNVKSFGIPNLINKIVYRFFRRGKAERSYLFGLKLKELGIGTPEPVAYFEFYKSFFFNRSFYISKQIVNHITFRELLKQPRDSAFEHALRAFTRFTYQMHEKSVFFLDHSQGNTLMTKNAEGYEFYLVDLNRMQFKSLDLRSRIKNFERLATRAEDVRIMSDEYAKCVGEDPEDLFRLMWADTQSYQHKFYRKRRIKKKLKFWKS